MNDELSRFLSAIRVSTLYRVTSYEKLLFPLGFGCRLVQHYVDNRSVLHPRHSCIFCRPGSSRGPEYRAVSAHYACRLDDPYAGVLLILPAVATVHVVANLEEQCLNGAPFVAVFRRAGCRSRGPITGHIVSESPRSQLSPDALIATAHALWERCFRLLYSATDPFNPIDFSRRFVVE